MNVLVVFGRSPRERTGKNRLRALIGGDHVDALCSAFLEDILDWELPPTTKVLVALTHPPDALRRIAPHAQFALQPEAGFGERIGSAFDSAFAAGAARVVIVGTDAPTLPLETLAACFDGLAEHRATLVPAEDGGWVALGVDAPLGATLAGVPWSSPATCAATRAALGRAGREPLILDPWYDVDDAAGLDRLRQELGGWPGSERAPRTATVLAATAH